MKIQNIIKKELLQEAEAIRLCSENIDESIEEIVELIDNCKGKIVVTGLGKTGIIGKKIAATLASTGTTSIFLHAAEGLHGDLGIISDDDIIIAISYTGNSDELLTLIPFFKFRKLPIIALTGNLESKLANNSDYAINISVPKNYEPFGLVPTASTTVALAVGDAIAVSLLKLKNFQVRDFAKFHPGGTIGKKIFLKVKDLMHSNKENPKVKPETNVKNVIIEMTSKGFGCTNVVDTDGKLVGFITDGDLRRMLQKNSNLETCKAKDIMTKNPKFVHSNDLAVESLIFMEDNSITMLPVVEDEKKSIAVLHMHDLIKAGVVG